MSLETLPLRLIASSTIVIHYGMVLVMVVLREDTVQVCHSFIRISTVQ